MNIMRWPGGSAAARASDRLAHSPKAAGVLPWNRCDVSPRRGVLSQRGMMPGMRGGTGAGWAPPSATALTTALR